MPDQGARHVKNDESQRDIRQPYPRNGIIRPLFLQIENYES